MIYIAGPLFKPEQIGVIKSIEDLLDHREDEYFSPREFGVIADEPMTKERMKRIFNMNILMLDRSNLLIAIIDDRDTGTVFEIGQFHSATNDEGQRRRIITYSSQGHGVNVMLAHAIFTHANTIEQLSSALNGHKINELEAVE